MAVVGSTDASFHLRLVREGDGEPETVGYSAFGTTEQLSMSLSRVVPLAADDRLGVHFTANGKDGQIVDFERRGSVFSVNQVG